MHDRQAVEEEKRTISTLKNAQATLHAKGIQFERVPDIVSQNAKLIHYMQTKNLLDEEGMPKE